MAPLVSAIALTASVASAAPITYTNVSLDPASGISYRRAPSTTLTLYNAQKIKPFWAREELFNSPFRHRGSPGVALLDYDDDGDVDLYVTNGPGRANSLYQNQLVPSGQLTFVDVGVSAGVDATDMDSTGVCYGDTDNDGDHDLLVLGRMEPNRMFENLGDGTFANISAPAGIGGGARGHTSCTMGDVNNDGLLDVFVANSFDWASFQAIFNNSYAYNHTNDLYVNQGGNVFADESEASGVRRLFAVPQGDGTISWATAMVDYDQDGDIDIFHADDQGAMAPSFFQGVDRGFLQINKNDGSGSFSNVTLESYVPGPQASSWMGLSFGDLNCDGHMDFFATSSGSYTVQQMGIPIPPGLDPSRHHIALGDGSNAFKYPFVFTDPIISVFGWGTGTADYDNDGDTDVIYYGNLMTNPFQSADNPGVILSNQGCNADFVWDQAATAANGDRSARTDGLGLALGDLNNDGFVDIVNVGGQYVPETVPFVRMNSQWGAPFDATARFLPIFIPIGPLEWEWGGRDPVDGYLDVMTSSGGNGNKWVKLEVLGTKDLTGSGKVNRDGIGAIVSFTPSGGKRSTTPVLGGSSHLSQHSLIQGFGLGAATSGTAEVFWPGGTRNRLYNVAAGETLLLPEIPCDFTATWQSKNHYKMCVSNALSDLVSSGTISGMYKNRLLKSALTAYDDAH